MAYDIRVARTGALLYQPHETSITPSPRGGPTVVTRDDDELFSQSFLDSLVGKPITLDHPSEFVSADTHGDVAVGTILAARKSGRFAVCDIIVTDPKAISEINSGVRELSLGYDAEYVEDAPGIGRQLLNDANHLAIVRRGRCGASCAIDSQPKQIKTEVPPMTFKEKLFAAIGKAIDETDVSGASHTDAEFVAAPVETTDEAVDSDAEEGITEDKAETQEPPKEEAVVDADPMAMIAAKLDAILGLLMAASAEEAAEAETEDMCGNKDGSSPGGEKVAGMDAASVEVDEAVLAAAEIIAPGIKPQADIKRAALTACRATTDGASIIDGLLDGADLESADVEGLFPVAVTLVKQARRERIATASRVAFDQLPGLQPGPVSPAKLSEIHAAYWANQAKH